jgi:hypothetical protein
MLLLLMMMQVLGMLLLLLMMMMMIMMMMMQVLGMLLMMMQVFVAPHEWKGRGGLRGGEMEGKDLLSAQGVLHMPLQTEYRPL